MNTKNMEEIVTRLKNALWPMAIYRFEYGSNGAAVESANDINLCIVVSDDEESTYHKALKAYSSLHDLTFSKNIIVRHESEFRKRSHWLDALEREIREFGDIIYGQIDEGRFVHALARREIAAAHSRVS